MSASLVSASLVSAFLVSASLMSASFVAVHESQPNESQPLFFILHCGLHGRNFDAIACSIHPSLDSRAHQVNFAGNPPLNTKYITAKGKKDLAVSWNEELWLPVMIPTMTRRVEVVVRCFSFPPPSPSSLHECLLKSRGSTSESPCFGKLATAVDVLQRWALACGPIVSTGLGFRPLG